jgi:translation initiation factor IF-2
MVNEGRVERGAKIRVLRDNVVINDSKIDSLRRYKDEVKEVKAGQDCGIIIENFNDIKVGDILETYSIEEIKAVLEPGGNKSEQEKLG